MKRKYNKGLSLVQLIIGMGIGLITVGMSIQGFINVTNSVSDNKNDSQSYTIFNEGKEILENEIHQAGLHCNYNFNDFTIIGSANIDELTPLHPSEKNGVLPKLYMGQFSSDKGKVILSDSKYKDEVILIDNYVPNTDYLLIQSTENALTLEESISFLEKEKNESKYNIPLNLENTLNFDKNDLLLACNKLGYYIFAKDNESQENNIIVNNDSQTPIFLPNGTMISKYKFSIYYIGESNNGEYGLYEYSVSNTNGDKQTLIINGIENMQIKYTENINSQSWINVDNQKLDTLEDRFDNLINNQGESDREKINNAHAIDIELTIGDYKYNFNTLIN